MVQVLGVWAVQKPEDKQYPQYEQTSEILLLFKIRSIRSTRIDPRKYCSIRVKYSRVLLMLVPTAVPRSTILQYLPILAVVQDSMLRGALVLAVFTRSFQD